MSTIEYPDRTEIQLRDTVIIINKDSKYYGKLARVTDHSISKDWVIVLDETGKARIVDDEEIMVYDEKVAHEAVFAGTLGENI